jgi:hypothetical protein
MISGINFHPVELVDESESPLSKIIHLSSDGGSISDQSETNLQPESVECKINKVKKLSLIKKVMHTEENNSPVDGSEIKKPKFDESSSDSNG